MDLIELFVGLPTGVLAVIVRLDDARMLLLAQDGQHKIKADPAWAGMLTRPGLAVITHRS